MPGLLSRQHTIDVIDVHSIFKRDWRALELPVTDTDVWRSLRTISNDGMEAEGGDTATYVIGRTTKRAARILRPRSGALQYAALTGPDGLAGTVK